MVFKTVALMCSLPCKIVSAEWSVCLYMSLVSDVRLQDTFGEVTSSAIQRQARQASPYAHLQVCCFVFPEW